MRLLLTVILFSLACFAQPKDAQEELRLGTAAFQEAHYPEAVEHFAEAVRLAPGLASAHLYLGATYLMMYIPGAESPENLENARQALDQFQQVLNLEPENDVAIAYTANLYFNQKKFDQATEWFEKLMALKPETKEAPYTLGVIVWSQWYPAYMKARADLGMKPADPGPSFDDTVRQELKSRWIDKLDRGIQYLEKALGIDPAYDDAMAYMNLLIRERADLDDSKEEYRSDIATADDWVRQALDIKKRKAQSQSPRP